MMSRVPHPHRLRRGQTFDTGSSEATNTDFWMNLTVVILSTVLATQVGHTPLDIGGRANEAMSNETPPVILELYEDAAGVPSLTLLPEEQLLAGTEAIADMVDAKIESAAGFAITTSAETSADAIQWALIALQDAGANGIKLAVRTRDRE